EIDRINMQRLVSLTANVAGADLDRAAREVRGAIARAGKAPKGVTVEVRGQVPILDSTLSGLGLGLGIAVIAILLLLSANYQSFVLSLVTLSTAPAVLAGVVLALRATSTTINVQSFVGAIMAIGVSTANAILLVT